MIHPSVTERLGAWYVGAGPFPCHRCATGAALDRRLVCADCDATWAPPLPSAPLASAPPAPAAPAHPQLSLF